MTKFYDMDGKLIGLHEWAELYEDFEGRLVAEADVGEHRVVSVWRGFDQSDLLSEQDRSPLIFTTALFAGPRRQMVEEVDSPSRDAALAEFDQLCRLAKDLE